MLDKVCYSATYRSRSIKRMAVDQSRLLTPHEASRFLHISRTKLYQLARKGDLIGHKVGAQWRFLPTDLMAYLERGGKPPQEETP